MKTLIIIVGFFVVIAAIAHVVVKPSVSPNVKHSQVRQQLDSLEFAVLMDHYK